MAQVRYVRAKEQKVVFMPDYKMWVALDPAQPMRSDDPVVKAFPKEFEADEDRVVEQATNAPGERRITRHRR
jgi:hypothetical protein